MLFRSEYPNRENPRKPCSPRGSGEQGDHEGKKLSNKEALVRSVNILQGTIKAALIVSKNEQGIETEPELKVYDREDISSIQKSKSN